MNQTTEAPQQPKLTPEDCKAIENELDGIYVFTPVENNVFKMGAEWGILHERAACNDFKAKVADNNLLLEARIKKLEEKYKDLSLSVQNHFQTLIARNYNNIGKWHNERQQYNFELIQELEAMLIKHNSKT